MNPPRPFAKSRSAILVPALGLALCVAFSPLIRAQGAATKSEPPTGGTKIGLVNIGEAIVNTNEGKKELEALQQKFAPKQARLKSLNDEVENLKKQLQPPGRPLSEQERAQQTKIIEEKQKTLQQDFEAYNAEASQAQNEVMTRIGQKMLQVMDKFAQANGYDLILDVANSQSPVLWGSKRIILNQALIDAYNAETAPAAPAAAAKP
jgi:Skp family chaperone for outer membrane proteins